MKLVNFKISVFTIAIGFVITACGGEKSKQEGETSESANTGFRYDWGSNEYTKHLPKPDMAISGAGEINFGGVKFGVRFGNNPTLEQVKEYVAKLKAAGFNNAANERTFDDVYSFEATNASGWRVVMEWAQYTSASTISTLKISKPKRA